MSETETLPPSLARGIEIIRAAAKSYPETPGVYRMINANDDILYIGKARALKRRVLSYTQTNRLTNRLRRMVSETVRMEVIRTHTEVEALLLEANMIKTHLPRYNVLLRDDKSYPYILITQDHPYPVLTKHRGVRRTKGEYFGPFASADAVNRTLISLQRVFMLRNCTDSAFALRNRPCLQYHIKRCTAPCVDMVSQDEYAQQVEDAISFMRGNTSTVNERLSDAMMKASDNLNFELAARYRDRLRALAEIQSKQIINTHDIRDADMIGFASREGISCISLFFVRDYKNFGNTVFFPKHTEDDAPEDILAAFIAQFYASNAPPPVILLPLKPSEQSLMAEMLTERRGRKVKLSVPSRGEEKDLLTFAQKNAEAELNRTLTTRKNDAEFLERVAELFELEEAPARIEVYDNSHISGTNMVGVMVVAGREGFNKKAYRKYNRKVSKEADDFGMMREVMSRRLAYLQSTETADDGTDGASPAERPDLLLIDGGAGQLSAVMEILQGLDIQPPIPVVAISKGPNRNAGRETFHLPNRAPFQLPHNDPVLHYLQRLRDEAHRFAIGTHRKKRQIEAERSPLDDLPGIGAVRKKALLLHFGSAKAVKRAGITDLMRVEGISAAMAEKIYTYFHSG